MLTRRGGDGPVESRDQRVGKTHAALLAFVLGTRSPSLVGNIGVTFHFLL